MMRYVPSDQAANHGLVSDPIFFFGIKVFNSNNFFFQLSKEK